MKVTIALQPVVGELSDDVTLVFETTDGESIDLTPDTIPGVYTAEVPAGTYRIRAEAGDLVAPSQTVEVERENLSVPIFLGGRGWPHYRLGTSVIPYRPNDDVVAIVRERREPDEGLRSLGSLDEITDRLGLAPYRPASEAEDDAPAGPELAEGAVRLFTQIGRAHV